MQQLGGMSIETFLSEYWQKKPLLIRQAFPDFQCPVDPDDLAGLACEDGVEARIVIENDRGKPWQVKHGPFTEKDFRKLPDSHWTLLIQGLDYWSPETSDLLEHFRFIPNWRIDDIMASYAPPHGSVGPHFDYYDVFLLQGMGRRRWKVGPICSGKEERVQGTPLRILDSFTTIEEWILEPGDMLYLPPQYAHYGTAEDDCITLSIGFRSPTHQEMLSSLTDYLVEHMEQENHLDDPNLQLQANPGEIKPIVLAQLQEILAGYLNNATSLADWFGRYTSAPKYDSVLSPPERPYSAKSLAKEFKSQEILRRNEGSRFSYILNKEGLRFFADGESFQLAGASAEIAKRLCSDNQLEIGDFPKDLLADPQTQSLLLDLLNQGSLYFDEFSE